MGTHNNGYCGRVYCSGNADNCKSIVLGVESTFVDGDCGVCVDCSSKVGKVQARLCWLCTQDEHGGMPLLTAGVVTPPKWLRSLLNVGTQSALTPNIMPMGPSVGAKLGKAI